MYNVENKYNSYQVVQVIYWGFMCTLLLLMGT